MYVCDTCTHVHTKVYAIDKSTFSSQQTESLPYSIKQILPSTKILSTQVTHVPIGRFTCTGDRLTNQKSGMRLVAHFDTCRSKFEKLYLKYSR